MAKIPITKDVSDLVGLLGEAVQNRSLLLDKFVFHKQWGSSRGEEHSAHLWSLLRVSHGGSSELSRLANEASRRSRSTKINENRRKQLEAESSLVSKLASTSVECQDAQELRRRHTRRFVTLIRSAYGDSSDIVIATLNSRLAINLSDGLLENAGICLDRLLGLPFIPGSAVKGVCRHAALEQLKAVDPAARKALFLKFQQVFGSSESDFKNGDLVSFRDLLTQNRVNLKGAVSFLPAYPAAKAEVVVDITNVHHAKYYSSGGKQEDAEESPVPNVFPTVEAGAKFAFILVFNGMSSDKTLLDQAKDWLTLALTLKGLGAKTSSGYGWFSINPEDERALLEEEQREAQMALDKAQREAAARAAEEAEAAKREKMSPEELACEDFLKLPDDQFNAAATGILQKNETEQKGFLMALQGQRSKALAAWRGKRTKKNEARVENIRKIAEQHGVELP